MLGAGLVGLLGWNSDLTSGQSADASHVAKRIWRDYYAGLEDNWQLAKYTIEYNSNPQCSKIEFKDGDVIDNEIMPNYYVQFWVRLLANGLLSDSDTKRIIAMLDNCHQINNPNAKSCSLDLEKESLSYALDRIIKELENVQAISQRYSYRLRNIIRTVTGNTITYLLETSNPNNFTNNIKAVQDALQDYCGPGLFNRSPFTSLELTEENINKVFETWKESIQNPSVFSTDLRAQKQLRHFLYDMLRMKLVVSSLSTYSNPPLSTYHNGMINDETQNHIDALLRLNIAVVIKSMPVDKAVKKLIAELSRGPSIINRYHDCYQMPDFMPRMYMFSGFLLDNSRTRIPIEDIKQRAEDMKKISDHFKHILEKTKQLKAALSPHLANTKAASSIHECVEYLAANPSSASSFKSNWMSNSPILHKLITSLLWTRLTQLLGLSR
ncbi:hypothetical protein NEHOM01_1593 [Nematocida homosporus]|uniref:uncharacterized protein n=1 Tax=Nematocida homosporus TaxID=1912981 RepID=UPI00222083FE|nr:uncharacterized protein NEHOM01_1593 [Nematocida homosporus]KAI5186625.1 hypothetical protein NEHOM01_1593 [Nematocida homosporus]